MEVRPRGALCKALRGRGVYILKGKIKLTVLSRPGRSRLASWGRTLLGRLSGRPASRRPPRWRARWSS